jgi:hypothetical protein
LKQMLFKRELCLSFSRASDFCCSLTSKVIAQVVLV